MDIGIASAPITLDSRYTDHDRPVLLSGIQALVRVLLEQSRLDRLRGWNTGGLVSGYRGSPLGGLDQELWRREAMLTEAGVRFQPGLNEDLAATMLWGAQQLETFPGQTVEGVFGMWYGKGPGVDRSADALRCANMVGTAANGGVIAVAGDDHAAHSSTFPHQTDHIFEAVMMPVLQPADVGEIIRFGLAGLAMSRFSGVWVALKTIAETAEQAAVTVVPSRWELVRPEIAMPPHGLNYDMHLSWPAERAQSERRMLEERLPAALAWARANGLNQLVLGPADAPVGIVTVGKAHHDAVHALHRLGLGGDGRVAVFKVGMSWPLETEGLAEFARGKRALIVVEEKRPIVEGQLRQALYNLPADARPPILGKTDLSGAPLLPGVMELSPELVLAALARVLPGVGVKVEAPEMAPALATTLTRVEGLVARAPAFCAGCPHNTGTRLPDGSYATAGIGCHIMALNTSDETRTFSHMGGEGVGWVGMAPFTSTKHIFTNMGDGTYQHSGLLAIRQAVAAKACITYKILYNDAVAMTGGQPAEGGFKPVDIARQVAAEGVGLIALVADDPARVPPAEALPAGTIRAGRDELDAVQRRLREHAGVSVLIYDQVCATEKRRRRKRGKEAAADVSVTINERVCENCGDCSVQSNCIALEPVETEYGRKRRVSPTACNTDLSCLKGFCPSFVTSRTPAPAVHGGEQWLAREAELADGLPHPAVPSGTWRGLFAGIGGGGIVTSGAIVAMAAHLEGRRVSTLDFTGLAQKNGAVVSHVQVADRAGELDVVRIPLGEADLMIAADLAVAASAGVLDRCRGDASVIGNLDLQPGAAFATHRDMRLDAGLHRRTIQRRAAGRGSLFLRGAAIAERLFGNAQAMNTVLLGMAWQQGLVPVGESALRRAIELNGTAVALNRRAFLWGRILAHRAGLADEIMADAPRELPVDELVEARAAELVRYGSQRLARRYRRMVARVAERGDAGLTRAAAEGYFRVLAIKDEYEVARLHSVAVYGEDPVFHMAPPLLSRTDPATGRKRKVAVPGRLALPLFRMLRHGKVLRGTAIDPFGWQKERRAERGMIRIYEEDVGRALGAANREAAVALLRWPMDVRGYGPVKAASWAEMEARRPGMVAALDGDGGVRAAA